MKFEAFTFLLKNKPYTRYQRFFENKNTAEYTKNLYKYDHLTVGKIRVTYEVLDEQIKTRV